MIRKATKGVTISSKTDFKRLLEPMQIKQVRFRNRLVKTPQDMAYANIDGSISQKNLDFYESIARGGVGAIIVEHAYVDFLLGSQDSMISVADDKMLPGLTKLVEVTHKHGCPVIQQINHLGPQYKAKSPGLQAVSSSALSEDYMRKTFGETIYNLRSLTIAEIEDIVEKFVTAAERVKNAGFDGVEIHAHRIYLLNSFLSTVWNKRDDEYGSQTLENRTRFAVKILREARARLGEDYVIGVRIKGAEYGAEEGITYEESQQIAKIFEASGADYINVAISTAEQMSYPEPPIPMVKQLEKRIISSEMNVPLGAAVKQVVSVPVIIGGRLDAVLGERILQEGMADAIALGRRLFADPELPKKLAEGKLNDIVPCTGCNTCLDLYSRIEPVACQVNAALGKGSDAEIRPAERRKRVIVVGGGPAGMEAARVAALRGHEVTLFDKEPNLGGLLPLAAMIKGTEIFKLPDLIVYLQHQITKLGVGIRLGEEFTMSTNEEIKPEVVILATGGLPDNPNIPGIDRSNVLTSEQLQRRVKFFLKLLGPRIMGRLTKLWLPIGKRVVIIGGLMHGCEAAEFLVKRGRKVIIIEATKQLGTGVLELYKKKLMNWLVKKGVTVFTEVNYKAITDRGLIITTKEGHEQTIEADTILVAVPPKPNTKLLQSLKGEVLEVYLVGDGKEPGLIKDAIAAGFQIGCTV